MKQHPGHARLRVYLLKKFPGVDVIQKMVDVLIECLKKSQSFIYNDSGSFEVEWVNRNMAMIQIVKEFFKKYKG